MWHASVNSHLNYNTLDMQPGMLESTAIYTITTLTCNLAYWSQQPSKLSHPDMQLSCENNQPLFFQAPYTCSH